MRRAERKPASEQTKAKPGAVSVLRATLHGTISSLVTRTHATKLRASEPRLLGAVAKGAKAPSSPATTLRKVNSVVVSSSHPELLDAVADFAAVVEKRLESDEAVIDALASSPQFPRIEHLEQLRRNAELRVRFMKEVPLLTSADVAKMSGSSARNASAKASRWKSEGRIFSVTDGGVDHYPAFQFDDDSGIPLPAMQDVLDVFATLSDWQIALWFIAPNAWLAHQPPIDVFARDPQEVISAARQAVAPLEV